MTDSSLGQDERQEEEARDRADLAALLDGPSQSRPNVRRHPIDARLHDAL